MGLGAIAHAFYFYAQHALSQEEAKAWTLTPGLHRWLSNPPHSWLGPPLIAGSWPNPDGRGERERAEVEEIIVPLVAPPPQRLGEGSFLRTPPPLTGLLHGEIHLGLPALHVKIWKRKEDALFVAKV